MHRTNVRDYSRRQALGIAGAGLLAAMAGLAGCSSADKQDDGTLKIVTTIYPLSYLAQRVAGDDVSVTNLVPAGTEPHDWEPTPSDIKAIQSANLFVYNGAGIESWVGNVLGSLGSGAPRAVCATESISLRTTPDGSTDPHVWLAPLQADKQAGSIERALCDIDGGKGDVYRANHEALTQELAALDLQFMTRLGACSRKEIVVSHEAFGYLCDAYGLTQVGIEGLSPDSEPDAARMAQIVDQVKSNGVTTIFFEELVSPKTAQAIASETGAKVEELNPLEGLTDQELAAGENYLSVMRDNLNKLEAALS